MINTNHGCETYAAPAANKPDLPVIPSVFAFSCQRLVSESTTEKRSRLESCCNLMILPYITRIFILSCTSFHSEADRHESTSRDNEESLKVVAYIGVSLCSLTQANSGLVAPDSSVHIYSLGYEPSWRIDTWVKNESICQYRRSAEELNTDTSLSTRYVCVCICVLVE